MRMKLLVRMILLGALLLMFLALHKVGSLENATNKLREIDPKELSLLTGPGPDNYLGAGLAISYFMRAALTAAPQAKLGAELRLPLLLTQAPFARLAGVTMIPPPARRGVGRSRRNS